MTSKEKTKELLLKAGIAINGTHPWDIRVHDERVYDRIFSSGSLGIGESYMDGWWDVEDHAWRWTARKFAVVLRAPIGAARRGATLRFNFTLPDVVFSHFKSLTLSASVEGTPLAPETYRRPGSAVYTREISAAILSAPSIRIDFGLDNAFSPGNGDPRQLGVIAHSLGLESQ